LSAGADLPKIQIILKRLTNYLLISFLLVQCAEDTQPQLNGPDFFPLAVGMYWIYGVEETIFSPLQPPAADTFQLMIQVVDSFPNSEMGFTYVLHRFTRQEENLPWQFIDTWSARLTDQFVILSEGNVPFIPLAFPVQPTRRWNGNLFNDKPEDEYQITRLLSDSSLPVDVVAEVVQENVTNNLTYRDVRIEMYGKAIGLLSKVSEVWTYTCTGGTCTSVINSGYKWVQYLEEYGTM
jgi:hypothetical protein